MLQIVITAKMSDVVGISSDNEIKKEIRKLFELVPYSGLVQDYEIQVIR
jgi:hypothetical protein